MNRAINKRLQKIASCLKVQYGAEQVILYGSYAQGTAGPNSDIDLLVIAQTDEKFYQRMATVKGLIRGLRKGLAVSPMVLTRKELEKRVQINDKFITHILKQGIRL